MSHWIEDYDSEDNAYEEISSKASYTKELVIEIAQRLKELQFDDVEILKNVQQIFCTLSDGYYYVPQCSVPDNLTKWIDNQLN